MLQKTFFGFRFGPIAIAIVTIVMIATMTLGASAMYAFSIATHRVKVAEDVIIEAQQLELWLVDAETGQRGFIITNDDGYLEVFQRGIDQFSTGYPVLFNTAADFSVIQQKVTEMYRLALPKITEMQDVIRVRRSDGFEAASKQVLTHLGKNLMDTFRKKTDECIALARQRLAEYDRLADTAAKWAAFSLFISLIATFLWIVLLARPMEEVEEE